MEGEPVITLVNSSNTSIHHKGQSRPGTLGGGVGDLYAREDTASQGQGQGHPSGTITGTTCTDFLSLPARAKIALTFQGDQRAEGFLALQKL